MSNLKKLNTINFKRVFIFFCLGILFLQLIQVFYFQREIFFTGYDHTYWKDRVEHSRYVLPLSDRGIGDDQFYAYGGYKIMQGQDPTSLVYDKPALGVAIIGVFAYYLQNPAFSGLFFGLGIVLLTYLLVSKITRSVLLGLVTATFLLLDPLFTQNLSLSLLDLPQLFFLLLSIYILLLVGNNRKYKLLAILVSGLALGIFAQIKIPVIYPFIFLMAIFWLYKTYGKVPAITFLIGNGIALLVGYIPYAFHNYSFIDFLKIQKYVIAFYRDSNLPLHMEAIWQYLFFGTFPGVVDRIPSRVNEWSFMYPIATVLGGLYSFKILLKKNEQYFAKSFAIILLVSLIVFTFIPSFPRYIILVLPFLYFFTVKALFARGANKGPLAIIVLLFLYSLVNNFYYFHQSPSSGLVYFYNYFAHQYFQDVYQEHIDIETKKKFTRDEFKQIAMKIFADAKIRNIEIKEGEYKYSAFDESVIVPVEITYKTEYLGEFSEKKEIHLVRENAKWKVKWQWSYLLNEYSLNNKVESTRITGTRGKIIDKNREVLAQDGEGYLVSINPDLLDGGQEKAMLGLLSKISLVQEVHLQNAYLENPVANTYIPLFTTHGAISANILKELATYKGIKVEEYPIRNFSGLDPNMIINTSFEECCTRIYSSYNYHGNKKYPGPELQYDKQLSGYDGGVLVIRDANGKTIRIIIQKNEKQGQDIILRD